MVRPLPICQIALPVAALSASHPWLDTVNKHPEGSSGLHIQASLLCLVSETKSIPQGILHPGEGG